MEFRRRPGHLGEAFEPRVRQRAPLAIEPGDVERAGAERRGPRVFRRGRPSAARHREVARSLPDGRHLRPDVAERPGGVDVEEEAPARGERAPHRPEERRQIGAARQVVDRVEEAGDEIDRLRQAKAAHVGLEAQDGAPGGAGATDGRPDERGLPIEDNDPRHHPAERQRRRPRAAGQVEGRCRPRLEAANPRQEPGIERAGVRAEAALVMGREEAVRRGARGAAHGAPAAGRAADVAERGLRRRRDTARRPPCRARRLPATVPP
jgi:hypothetical protein